MDKVRNRQPEERMRLSSHSRRMRGCTSPQWTALTVLMITIIPRINCLQYWRRLGPIPEDMTIGSSCKSSLQCLLFVPHSHCDWDSRTCTCQSYHIHLNSTTCLPASLLGFGCAVDKQCTLKVPNSRCHDGLCQCHDNFVTYRRDKCLPPAKVDGYCLNDRQCTLGSSYTYCKYIIPRVYGKCRCPIGYIMKKGQCLPPLGKKCDSDADCEAATSNSFCRKPSTRSREKEPVCTCRKGFMMSSNKTACEPIPAPVSIAAAPSIQQPFVNITGATSDLASVSLGKFCNHSLECQVRDPYSLCLNGICECVTPSSRCNAQNTGCHKDTFQCRNGQCISWYFVCDKNKNCEDGSDEDECTSNACPAAAFQCDDGTCLPRSSVCNGRWECPDGSDEARCYKNIACDAKSFRCSSGQCLPQYSLCNAVTDCIDGSDELDEVCEKAQTCPEGSFQCRNKRCRSTAILCSGVDGCGDNSDEDRCEVCFCEKPMQ